MRNILKLSIVVATLALAGCVYPGYSYVRGGYGGGYYSGDAYGYYGGGYYAPAYPGYYDDGCCYYGPSVGIDLGYYDRGYRGYRGGYRDRDGHAWRGNGSHGNWHGDSHHEGGSRHDDHDHHDHHHH